MKTNVRLLLMPTLLLCVAIVMHAQTTRTDAIWARTTTTPIVIDGVLNEAAWAAAESVKVYFGRSSGIPGSGWFREQGAYPSDPTNATVKFLVRGDSLYVAVIAKDKSVGGGEFNKFDGVLSNVRYRQATGFQGTPDRSWNTHKAFEIFYAWVKEGWADTLAATPGRQPFFGGFAGSSPYAPRPDSLKRIWDAATTVQGTQNDDRDVDQGYTMEFKINLRELGYDVTRPEGDIVMYNLSIYDADWQWPLDSTRFSGNRAWLQGPWGNATFYNHMRIYTKPSVTTSTNPLPSLGPDLRVPNAQAFASPVIDGRLSESVWQYVPSFKIQYGNGTLRNSYPNTGAYRSGQFQPDVNGAKAPVLDPSEATVKYFFKGDTLFLGFDVNDQVVQYHPDLNRRDGFRVTINDRAKVRGDSSLFCWQLRFFVDSTGAVGIGEDTPFLRDSIQAVRLALALKPGTTVDTLGQAADAGYTAEVAINLNKLGYAAGRGDGIAFLGVSYYDGDSFTPASGSYATRTWWFRDAADGNFSDGPAWVYLDPAYNVTTAVDAASDILPETFALIGNYPNPFNPSTTVRYTVPEAGTVTMLVFDVLGRKVASLDGGFQTPGVRQLEFNAGHLSSGTYFYYLEMVGAKSKNVLRTATGKMALVK
jgi:hypothetical protein